MLFVDRQVFSLGYDRFRITWREVFMELRELTKSQKLIMKCVWEYEGEANISYSELLSVLKEEYGHEYKLVTLVTFLRQMTDKGYLTTFRRGKTAYVKPLVSREEFLSSEMDKMTKWWFDDKPVNVLESLSKSRPFTEEDKAQIRAFMDQI